jgi:REP element-mobilizing transposase RayT
MGLHRNSQKRIYIPGATYFITTVTHGRYPYFEEEIFRELFLDELLFCSELKSFSLYAYAVMPDHAHVLIRPMGGWDYSEIIGSLKRNFSRDCNYVMGFNDTRCVGSHEGADSNPRLHGNPRVHGNNAIVESYRNKFVARHGGRSPHPPFRWQKSYHDHIIRDMDDLRNHLAYIARQCSHHGCDGSVWVGGEDDEL